MRDDTPQILALCSSIVSSVTCLVVLWMYFRLRSIGHRRPVTLTTNLRIYMVVIFVDLLWSSKYALESCFYFINQMTNENRCKLFGFFETAYTLLQCFVVLLFWLHVAAALRGRLHTVEDSNGEYIDLWWCGYDDYLIVRVYVLTAAIVSLAAAVLAISNGFIQADDPLHADGMWCWVRMEHGSFDWPPILFSYAWQAVNAVALIIGLFLPTCTVRTSQYWGRSTHQALLRRGGTGLAHIVITILSVLLRYAAHNATEEGGFKETLVVIAAILFPLNGFIDAIAFIVSEPGLLSTLVKGERVTPTVGFHNGLEEIKRIANTQSYEAM